MSLKTVWLPSQLKKIGTGTFYYCSNLEKVGVDPGSQSASVVLPAGVTEIPENAFRECNKLTSVVMTNNVKSIGRYAFEGCDLLKDPGLVEGLERIESRAFAYTAITEIEIPSTVSYYYSAPGTVTGSYDAADHPFYQVKLTKVTIGGALKAVDRNTFGNYWPELLTEIVLRNDVTEIGDSTFSSMRSNIRVSI